MKHYLVTGGAGFIGSTLSKNLLKKGNKITIFDNFQRGMLSRIESIKEQVTIVNGDIRNLNDVFDAMQNIDTVYHLAAVNGTENFYNHSKLVLDVGIKGILNIMEAAEKYNTNHVIVASSAEVYQTPSVIPTDEKEILKIPSSLEPRYSYACSKIATEVIAINYGKNLNKVQIFRPHNIYGPDMGWKHVIPNLVDKILLAKKNGHKKIEIYGTGEQTRSFCFVEDLLNGLDKMEDNGGHLEIFHIGNQQEITINELAKKIASIVGINIELIPTKTPKGETDKRCPDISKISGLNYYPLIDIDEGLARTVPWYIQNTQHDFSNKLL